MKFFNIFLKITHHLFINTHLAFIALLLLSSCSATKFLADDQTLYTGAEITIVNQGKIPSQGELESELADLATPEPNQSIFGMRPKLWIYFVTRDTTKDKGLKNWLNTKLGEPPVLLEDVDPDNTDKLMTSLLYNNGYFQAEVEYEVEQKKKTASINYNSVIKSPYRISRIIYPDDSAQVSDSLSQQASPEIKAHLQELKEESLIKIGDPYSLDIIIEERERIDRELKNEGYFYFNADYLLFQADSTEGDRQVALYLRLKPDMPSEAEQIYTMNNVFINDDYTLSTDSVAIEADTLMVNNYHYISNDHLFRPEIITQSVFLEKDSIYTRRGHDLTLNRLMGLGAFKFVNVRFSDADTLGSNELNALVQLTPLKKKSVEATLQAISKSNGFAGPGINLSFRNRNAFGGAELLTVQLVTGFETQISGRQQGLNTYEVGLETELLIPRFITPFNLRVSSNFVPKTRFGLGYRLQNRVNYFLLNSFSFNYGYIWKEDIKKQHEFNPVDINYLQVGNESEAFDSLLTQSPILARSFAQQFILGSTYSFTYNSKLEEQRPNEFFFNGNIDISGNLAHLLQNNMIEEASTFDEPYTIFGSPYSQYTRVDADFRYYHNFKGTSSIASRLIAGVGIPYGNSSTLPYIKQFFIGGTNSIRAFLPRSLGPGTYQPPDSVQSLLIDQVGDIRLEGNVEYRFDIYSILKGALFVDAGNIWLVDENPENVENPEKAGGEFNFDTFLNQVAVGTGFGLRIDASFFVLRFDFAFPIRKPFPAENERWVFDEIDFGSRSWRRDNLVLNIGIGYPF